MKLTTARCPCCGVEVEDEGLCTRCWDAECEDQHAADLRRYRAVKKERLGVTAMEDYRERLEG